MTLNRGLYIALEGIDGSGKTTLARNLESHFKKQNMPTLVTKEPGGSCLGKKIRSILQEQPVPITAPAEFLLFAADRAQHFSEVIAPALEKNMIILSDRSGDSSLAYQGYGRGLDKEMIKKVNQWAMQNRQPDYIIFVNIPVEVAISRYKNRGEKLTSFESEKQDFFERIAQGFQEMYAQKENVIIIDGTKTQEAMINDVLEALVSKKIIAQDAAKTIPEVLQ